MQLRGCPFDFGWSGLRTLSSPTLVPRSVRLQEVCQGRTPLSTWRRRKRVLVVGITAGAKPLLPLRVPLQNVPTNDHVPEVYLVAQLAGNPHERKATW